MPKIKAYMDHKAVLLTGFSLWNLAEVHVCMTLRLVLSRILPVKHWSNIFSKALDTKEGL